MNKEIERQIEKDKLAYRRTHRVLLLGAGGSGKTTLMEQMRTLHSEMALSNEEKKQNIKSCRGLLLTAADRSKKNQTCVEAGTQSLYV